MYSNYSTIGLHVITLKYVYSGHSCINVSLYVPSRRIWLTQLDGAFTMGGMVTSGDELICPVSFRTVKFPLIINEYDPSPPICSVLSQQQLANLRWTDNSFQTCKKNFDWAKGR